MNIPANGLGVLMFIKATALMEFIDTKEITDSISKTLYLEIDSDDNLV